jgi:hypothetical protein
LELLILILAGSLLAPLLSHALGALIARFAPGLVRRPEA